MTWRPIENVREFLTRHGAKRVREHAFTERILHWPYCKQCGLVCLKNEASRRAAAGKCVTWE